MHGNKWFITAVALLGVAFGCSNPARTNLGTPINVEDARPDVEVYLKGMADNGAMQDMSVADIHFVPHTSELSGTGVHRLDQLTPTLRTYGGKLRYETYALDEELVASRLLHVSEYLEDAGLDMDRVEVVAMISGGRGLNATEAMRILKDGTAKKQQSGSSGQAEAGDFSSSQ